MSFSIEFQVTCKTQFGQQAVLCGNLPELGQWKPQHGLRLETGPHLFPLWTTKKKLLVQNGATIEFKLCRLNAKGQLVKWEQISANRIFSPRASLIIRLKQDDENMQHKVIMRKASIRSVAELPVRKGTEEVINDLASDSSSNRQMWQEHQPINEQEISMMLFQFVESLRRSISMQKEQALSCFEPELQMQGPTELTIGNYFDHEGRRQVIILPSERYTIDRRVFPISEHVEIINLQKVEQLTIQVKKDQIIIFHILADRTVRMNQVGKIKQFLTLNKNTPNLVIVHAIDSVVNLFKQLELQAIDVLICLDENQAAEMMEALAESFNIQSKAKNQFLVLEKGRVVLKIILENIMTEEYISQPSVPINRMLPKAVQNFCFSYKDSDSRAKLRSHFSMMGSANCHCLLVFHLASIDSISQKIMGDLIQLTFKYDTWVSVLIDEKFPANIREMVPLERNRMIMVDNQGQIYTNGDVSSIYDYIEISKEKFVQNVNLIIKEAGLGVQNKTKPNSMGYFLEFPNNKLGQVFQQWTIRAIRDINKKSLAKIYTKRQQSVIEMMPFVIHPAFLLKALKNMFINKLKINERGVIICINCKGSDLLQQQQPTEGQDVKVDIVRFILSDQKTVYRKTPLSHSNLSKLLNVIAEIMEIKMKEEDEKVLKNV